MSGESLTRAAIGSTALTLIVVAGPVLAQDVVLDSPTGTVSEGFGLVQSIRELPDGRVVFADPLGKALLVADMDAGALDTLGGEGAGPDEYRQPDNVFPWPGDGTLLVDLGNARMTRLGADLEFGATLPLASGRPGPGGNFVVRFPQGVDSDGRIYYREMAPGRGEPPTHASVLRWDPEADQVDSVTAVLRESVSVQRSGGPNNQNVSMGPVPLSPQDGWAVAWDGRVAVVRADPYRVEWIWPDGRVVTGPEVPYDRVRIDRGEKEEWVEARESRGGGVAVSVSITNGDVQTGFARGGGSGRPNVDQYEWPEVKPPFDANDVLVSLSGEVWVRKHLPAGEAPVYDVFGSDGELRYTVGLEEGRRVIGFGSSSVYVVRIDDLGLQYVERHPSPNM